MIATQVDSAEVFFVLVDLRHLPLYGIICLQILGKGSIQLRVLFGESVSLVSRMQQVVCEGQLRFSDPTDPLLELV